MVRRGQPHRPRQVPRGRSQGTSTQEEIQGDTLSVYPFSLLGGIHIFEISMGEGDYQQMSLGRKGYNEGKREKE